MKRALVLGGGGVTGLAWELGVLGAFADAGLPVTGPERFVGTSAGAIVAAHLALGRLPSRLIAHQGTFATLGRVDAGVLAPLLWAQVAPDRARALRWLGRRAGGDAGAADAFIAAVGRSLADQPWPRSLVLTTVDAATGHGRLLTWRSEVPLDAAVAASASVPGVFGPIELHGVPHLDGGLRSPANADAARGCDRVLVLAPQSASVRPARRPRRQLARLGSEVRSLLITPDATARRAIGVDPLRAHRTASIVDAGRRQGERLAAQAVRLWQG